MSLVPIFEIGVWNAWILTIFLFLFVTLSGLLPKDIGKRITPAKEDSKIRRVMLIVFFVMIIYSIFLPLKIGTAWLYIGLAIYIIGFISVNLGIVNLLPIPIADGGQILLFGLEKVRGRPLSQKKQIIIQQVGIGLLIFLFILITWNDVLRWVSR